jgi:hypothetical protein
MTTRFGYAEFFALRAELGCEAMLVVNLLDGLARRRPLAEAAQHAAGLIAWAMADAGRPVRYVQLGNEWWMPPFQEAVSRGTGIRPGDSAAFAPWCIEVLTAYVDAIRAVAPQVDLVIDAQTGFDAAPLVLSDARLRREVRWAALHAYAPLWVREPPAPGAGDAAWWESLCACFGERDAAGCNTAYGDRVRLARSLGYRIAATEWNWNGWWAGAAPRPAFAMQLAAGIGAAGFLNGLLRQGDAVGLATQSMLIGTVWGITGIRTGSAGADPVLWPQAQVTRLYATHHGDRVLPSQLSDVPLIAPAPGFNQLPAAAVDVVVTAADARVCVHAVNLAWDRPAPIRFAAAQRASGRMHLLDAAPEADVLHERTVDAAADGLLLPPRSVAVAVYPR